MTFCVCLQVFDGHGGHRASEYGAAKLYAFLIQQDYKKEPERALKEAFLALDRTWLQAANQNNWDDGSTIIAVLIVNETLYVANLGDSRAVLCSDQKALALSDDHKPNRPDEKARVEKLGGRIHHYGAWRVEGILAVSRALGDRRLKRYVTGEPEIMVKKLSEQDEFMLLASDGVWDVLSNQEAVDIARFARPPAGSKEAKEAENAKRSKDVYFNPALSSKLVSDLSFHRGSQDNITTLTIDLRPFVPNSRFSHLLTEDPHQKHICTMSPASDYPSSTTSSTSSSSLTSSSASAAGSPASSSSASSTAASMAGAPVVLLPASSSSSAADPSSPFLSSNVSEDLEPLLGIGSGGVVQRGLTKKSPASPTSAAMLNAASAI